MEILKNLRYALSIHGSDFVLDSEILTNSQVNSKAWLIKELEKLNRDLEVVFVVGGWYGILPAMMFESNLKIDCIRSFDIDSACEIIAEDFNFSHVLNEWRFKASTADMYKMNYDQTEYTVHDSNKLQIISPNTIINTSCEHIESISDWLNLIPKGKLLVLQSNDYFDYPDHINCSENLDDFKEKVDISNILYAGELQTYAFKRFMIIGER